MGTTARGRDPAAEEEFLGALYKGGELLAAGKVVEARSFLEKAQTIQPKHEKALNLLGLTYFKLGLFDRAADVYESLVRDNPADATLRVNLGLVHLKTNSLTRAVKEFETATDLEPAHKKAHNYLGLALAQTGDYSRAREHFQRAGSDVMVEKMARAMVAKAETAPPTQALEVPPAPPVAAATPAEPPPAPVEAAPAEVATDRAPEPPEAQVEEAEIEPETEEELVAATPAEAPVEAAWPVAAPPPPPAEEVVEATLAEPEDGDIEVMSDDELPPTDEAAEQVGVEMPVPTPSSPINADWGSQFGIDTPPSEEELRAEAGQRDALAGAEAQALPFPTEEDGADAAPRYDDEDGDRTGEVAIQPLADDDLDRTREMQIIPLVTSDGGTGRFAAMSAPEEADEDRTREMEIIPLLVNAAERGAPRAVFQASAVAESRVEWTEPMPPPAGWTSPENAPSEPWNEVRETTAPGVVPASLVQEAPVEDAGAYQGDTGAYAQPDPGQEPGAGWDTAAAETSNELSWSDVAAESSTAAGEQTYVPASPAPSAEDYQVGGEQTYVPPPAEAPDEGGAGLPAEGADAYALASQAGGDASAPEAAASGADAASWTQAWEETPSTTPQWQQTAPDVGEGAPPAPEWISQPTSGEAPAETPAWIEPAGVPMPTAPTSARTTGKVVAVPPPVHVDLHVPPEPIAQHEGAEVRAGYSTMGARRLIELGASTQWVTEPTTGPFHVGPDGLAFTVHGELLARLAGLVAIVGSVDAKPENRRVRGRGTDQPFGAPPDQLQRITGSGVLYLEPGRSTFQAIDLDEEGAYLREERVWAFEEVVAFENGRLTAEGGLALDLVHLKGNGRVLLRLEGALKVMPVQAGAPMVVPLARVIGWFGLLSPRLVGFAGQTAVELTGEGYALLATAERRAEPESRA